MARFLAELRLMLQVLFGVGLADATLTQEQMSAT
jgi:hypothetical protein